MQDSGREAPAPANPGDDHQHVVHVTVAFAIDPILFEIVLDNLLGNALAYAPAGSVVNVRGTRVGVSVDNAAPWLRTSDLANFGQRVWRKDAQGAGHAGLGLALAGAAARALRMSLTFTLDDGVLQARLYWGPDARDGATNPHAPTVPPA